MPRHTRRANCELLCTEECGQLLVEERVQRAGDRRERVHAQHQLAKRLQRAAEHSAPVDARTRSVLASRLVLQVRAREERVQHQEMLRAELSQQVRLTRQEQ